MFGAFGNMMCLSSEDGCFESYAFLDGAVR